MIEPLVEVWKWFMDILPNSMKIRRPKFNFLTVHYLYILGMTILGSIMLYPNGGMPYTDALFFAAGMSTQSGLNTLNVNQLNTYQQVVMMLIPCVCTPIFINTVVVFVRLYWFEKRFKHMVQHVRGIRRARTRSLSSRTKSQNKADDGAFDESGLERGVNGRPITVLHETTVPNGMNGSPYRTPAEETPHMDANENSADTEAHAGVVGDEFDEKQLEDSPHTVEPRSENNHQESDRDSENATSEETAVNDPGNQIAKGAYSPAISPRMPNPTLHREITFADELPKPGSSSSMRPSTLAAISQVGNRHIEFVERQKQNKENKHGALRIPGPRDFDRGELPQELGIDDDAIERPLSRQISGRTFMQGQGTSVEPTAELNGDDHPIKRGITIDDSNHPPHRERRMSMEEERASEGSIVKRLFNTLAHHGQSRSMQFGEAGRSFARTMSTFTTRNQREIDPSPYLSWEATTGRNSEFFDLTQQQREELGGIEYRALKTLAIILLSYYFGFHILGLITFLPWILGDPQQFWRSIVEEDAQSPTWWGIFTPASMFNDLGFTLTPDSMSSFQWAVFPLLFGSFLIIIGNTGFPCMLRFMIWILSKIAPKNTPLWEELRFLLDHPRRCFTLLFPSRATWWLFWVLVVLNGLDLIFFIILDLNDSTVTSIPTGLRVLNGWFQAASTRTAGFACVNIANLHPAIQVSYLIMMYISVFPIAISVRRTNVYEEKSLGIFGGEETVDENGETSYVGQHLRRQLSFDLWYIFLGLFIIAIVEGGAIADNGGDKVSFTLFSILFEIVSAYGTVGLSLGYPNTDTSFSAQFHVISKLVIIAMMVRGRHRGLPYALDRAILLPSEKLQQKEAEDADRRLARSRSSFFVDDERAWSENVELDDVGLPQQNLGLSTARTMPTRLDSQSIVRRPIRRSSNLTTNSQTQRRERSRSLGRFLASGLGAGPTISRHT